MKAYRLGLISVLALIYIFGDPLTTRAQELIRGPYLQMLTPNSAVVRWRTDRPTTNYVHYGKDPKKLDALAFSQGWLTEHVVMVTDLAPFTKYFYSIATTNKVLAGGDTNYYFVTAPEPGSLHPARIWVLGDSGTRTEEQKAVRDAYYQFNGDRPTDGILMLGDNAYDFGKDQEYQGAVFEMYADILRHAVLWPTLGNHDNRSCDSPTQSGVYYNIFTLPKQADAGGVPSGTAAYYSFDYANAHFICLDSQDDDHTTRGRMLDWLKQDLAQNHRTWTFAYFHHPPYTKGSHNSDLRDQESGGRLTEIREQVVPLLEAGGVDMVLCGHSHDYERSFLIDGHYGTSDTFTDRYKKNGGDGQEDGQGAYHKKMIRPAPHQGTVYVVCGCSGKISGGKLNHPAMFTSFNELGSLILDIKTNRVDTTFLNWQGVARDHFTMTKGPAKGRSSSR